MKKKKSPHSIYDPVILLATWRNRGSSSLGLKDKIQFCLENIYYLLLAYQPMIM